MCCCSPAPRLADAGRPLENRHHDGRGGRSARLSHLAMLPGSSKSRRWMGGRGWRGDARASAILDLKRQPLLAVRLGLNGREFAVRNLSSNALVISRKRCELSSRRTSMTSMIIANLPDHLLTGGPGRRTGYCNPVAGSRSRPNKNPHQPYRRQCALRGPATGLRLEPAEISIPPTPQCGNELLY